MATIMVDFDSTLCPFESLEIVCEHCGRLDLITEFKRYCKLAMAGQMTFEDSIRRRFAMFQPHKDILKAVGEKLSTQLTSGFPEAIQTMKEAGHTVFVVSGGLKDLITHAVAPHSIVSEDIFALSITYDEQGHLSSVIEDGFHIGKPHGLRKLNQQWEGPIIIIGDGTNDLELKTHKFVDYFIAYTEHEHRPQVVKEADYVAGNTEKLISHLLEIL